MDEISLGQKPMVGFCKSGNDPSACAEVELAALQQMTLQHAIP